MEIDPNRVELLSDYAASELTMGEILRTRWRFFEAEEWYRHAMHLSQMVCTSTAFRNPQHQWESCVIHELWAGALLALGRLDDALEQSSAALAQVRDLVERRAVDGDSKDLIARLERQVNRLHHAVRVVGAGNGRLAEGFTWAPTGQASASSEELGSYIRNA